MRRDLARRSSEPELMDGADTDYETLRSCLRDLARVNVLSLGYRPTLAFMDRLWRAGRLAGRGPIKILDVGCGYGDGLRAVNAWADRRGLSVHLTGVDLNPQAIQAAREATPPDRPIRWATSNAFDYDGPADLVVSSLFAHHLDDAGVARFLGWMEGRARIGWFVNDLHRHRLPHATFGLLASALGLHRFVRHDGPVSFARAFVPADWQRLLRAAGIPFQGTEVRRWFPFRLCVARHKPA